MSDYDNDRLLAMQRDGVRTVSGHHMREMRLLADPISQVLLGDPDYAAHFRHTRWNCTPCRDEGCDFCNEVPDGY